MPFHDRPARRPRSLVADVALLVLGCLVAIPQYVLEAIDARRSPAKREARRRAHESFRRGHEHPER